MRSKDNNAIYINNKNNALSNWSKAQKYELLLGIRQFGSSDLKQLSSVVCTKTQDEIEAAIKFYKSQTTDQECVYKLGKKKGKGKDHSYVPLSCWAQFISEHYTLDKLQVRTPVILRLIAEFEKRPPPSCTEKFDFKKIYNVLADVMEGKPLPDNKHIKAIIDMCLVEAALTSRGFFKSASNKQVLKAISITTKKIEHFNKPTKSYEVANIRHMLDETNYNPLNIPEYFIKSSSSEIVS